MHSAYQQRTSHFEPETETLIFYNSNIKTFTYKVGCPEAHDDPERNIAELRKFHSSQMPVFKHLLDDLKQLQDEFKEQTKLNSEQQEIITALVFRHLLENLPPEQTKSGNKDSTHRWREFWEDAARHELRNPNPNHLLHGLMPPDAITKQHGDFSDGKKGLTFRTGRDLFGTLSSNIHKYKGGRREGYDIVRKDQWGVETREILVRLIPEKFDGVGEVEWGEERKRYHQ